METVKIKHREFNIVSKQSEDIYILERKGVQYLGTKFTPKTQEAKELTYAVRKISTSGVKAPKVFFIDEKAGFIVNEILEGEKMSDYLSHSDMSEDMYEQLFQNAYFAKISHMTLDYSPEWWLVKENTLYYMRPMFIIYKKEKDLTERYLRLWFNTSELANYLSNLGIFYDKSRIKEEYSTNKEIVLKVCKYYR